MLAKTPFFGTSPFKLLKEKFNICKSIRFSNSVGIKPKRLLEKLSKLSSSVRFSHDFSIESVILFLAMLWCWLLQEYFRIAGFQKCPWCQTVSNGQIRWAENCLKSYLPTAKILAGKLKKIALECLHWVLSLLEQASLIAGMLLYSWEFYQITDCLSCRAHITA